MRGDAPRQRDDVDAVIGLVSTLPSRVFVVDDPLDPVHGRLVEFLFNQVVFKRTSPQIGADTDIDEVGIRGRAVEVGLCAACINARRSSHAHAGRAVLVSVVGVVCSIGFSSPSRRADRIGVNITHGIVACDEFLAQPRVLVVDARVHHSDVHVSARVAQIPRTHGVETGIACLHGRCLDVTVEDHRTVAFNHHNIVKSCEIVRQGGVDLTQQHRIHGVDHVNHREVHRFEFIEVR